MTKLSENIEKARRLVGEFYDGTTSREDERWLKSFFCSVDATQLPEGMRDDAELFRLVDDEASKAVDIVPEDLERRIRSVMSDETVVAPVRRRSRILSFSVWAGTAAAVMVLVFTVLPFNRYDAVNVYDSLVASAEIDEDGYYEITDEEDAARLIAHAMGKAGEKMAVAQATLSKTDTKVKTIEEIINKILNHKSLKTS